MNTTFTADQSALLLTAEILARRPFFFIRYGDGAMECMTRPDGLTCDGEHYSPEFGRELRAVWDALLQSPANRVYVGDWLSATFEARTEHTRYDELYRDLIGGYKPRFLHFEALLLMRPSLELVHFYRAVKNDSRRKLFMGPAGNRGAAEMLGAEFLETPMSNLRAQCGYLEDRLVESEFDVLLYGAGMAGNIPAVRCWQRFPERTYINLGSAMDPLFRGRSRRQQLHPQQARALFRDLLGFSQGGPSWAQQRKRSMASR